MRKESKRFYTFLGYIAVAYFLLLFIYPIGRVVMSSVMINDTFSLVNYFNLFTGTIYIQSLIKTLWVSLLASIIALLIGYSLALFIHSRDSDKQGFWLMLIISPMFMSLTIRLYGFMIILSKEGMVQSILGFFAKSSDDISLLFSPFSVTIGIAHYLLPFVVLNIYSVLKRIDPVYMEASSILGGSNVITFYKVIFPLSIPGIISASTLSFALATSAFLVPLMLGGPSDNLIANMAYDSIVKIGNVGMGGALSVVLLITVIVTLVISNVIEKRWKIV